MEHQGRRGLRQRLFAWCYGRDSRIDENDILNDYKRRLLSNLSGHVLEIGPGTGANFTFLPHDVHWIGIEPNLFMHDHLRTEAQRLALPEIDLRAGTAEQVDVPDSSVDAVISTHVLCSVDDQTQALREIHRVLKPGGRFVFIEHVAAPRGSSGRRAQSILRPVWSFFGDGCHPDRETWAIIENTGFAQVEIEHFHLPYPIVGPHIAGYAVK
ncbi:MAG: class I SAM-dependent methyltransferase [Chloroflexi bacterium]|nr:class I SAM-dependent methyltransferase [Chloroflexota bacterium]